jgi:gamma-glutamylcyclotransferase (GGCT)/AIG2-like uncharacterized protein YtfP
MPLPPPGQPGRLPPEPVALFAYGTLAFPEVMRVLLSRVPDNTAAAVAGWRIAALSGRVYPGLVAAEALARGRLVTGLSTREWRILDAFEDDLYELRRLTLTDGRYGWSYVCVDSNAASAEDWDLREFEKDDLVDFLRRCARWRAEYKDGQPGADATGD